MDLIGGAWWWITEHATLISAVISALAAASVAVFTYSLMKVTGRQEALTEETLRADRPWIFIEIDAQLHRDSEYGETVFALYDIVNHGKSPAIITECLIDVAPAKIADGPSAPILDDRRHGVIGPGNRMKECRSYAPGNLSYGSSFDPIFSSPNPTPELPDGEELIFHAVITYADIRQISHVSSFCWRFDVAMHYWIKFDGEQYNYTT